MKILHKWYWEDIFYNTIRGIRNLFKYFKIVWSLVPWDISSVYKLMKFQLEILSDSIKNGYEMELSRDEKVKDINRCIEILNNIIEDNFYERCGFDDNFNVNFKSLKKQQINGINNLKGECNTELFELNTTETKEQKQKNAKAIKDANELYKNEITELFDIMKKSGSWWD